MINFRYHVVSLVAVFLALAVGVVMGYGVLGQPTVESLENRVKTVNRRVDETRAENQRLRDELDRANTAIENLAPFASTDRLPITSVVVLAARDVDGEVIDGTVALARRGGATVPGVLWLEPKWALRERGDAADLARALNVPSARKGALRQQGYLALASRLVEGPPATGEDVLAQLVRAGFVTIDNVGNDDEVHASDVGGPGTRALVADGTGDSELPARIVGPLARASTDAVLPLVVAETYDEDSDADRGTLLDPVRDTEALATSVSTVDDLERTDGRTAAVLALSDLGRDVVGHYGYGDGATRPLPEWWQP
jgi:hypothetical protein